MNSRSVLRANHFAGTCCQVASARWSHVSVRSHHSLSCTSAIAGPSCTSRHAYFQRWTWASSGLSDNHITVQSKRCFRSASATSSRQTASQAADDRGKSDDKASGDPETLPESFRKVMRRLTHAVVVCSVQSGDAIRAMTMSSLTSLSLLPTPLVTFNVATPSRTLEAIKSTDEFEVHVVADNEAGARFAESFAKGNGPTAQPMVTSKGSSTQRRDGVLYTLRCKLSQEAPLGGLMQVRDHVIVVAEVIHIDHGQGQDAFGLAYANGTYRTLGNPIRR